MPTIGAAVDAETKERFGEAARMRNLTPSKLAGALITEFLNRERNESAYAVTRTTFQGLAPVRSAAKTEQVHVRLEPYYYAELGRVAAQRNWYRATYLANLLTAHIDQRPVLCQAEIDGLRPIARYLADMGRNINQVAKKLNASMEHMHLATAMDLNLVRALLDLERNAVAELIRANVKGWGINDGES